jgi:hypothetical protein
VIIYRAIRRKTWFDPDDPSKVKSEAFMRRRPKETPMGVDVMDADGLSVFDASQIGLQECVEQNKRCFGVASLHVGTMRDMGLNVIWDASDSRKVLIVNLPLENPNDAIQEALADRVAASARVATKCDYRRPE